MYRITIFLFLFIQICASAQSFYVDQTSGNDSNDGMSLGSAWATIQKACEEATPGSTVEIRGGIYHENLQMEVSGSSGSPISFTNYQNEAVIIDGTGTNGTSLLRITNKSWLHFENLEFRNLVRNNAKGIMVETSVNGYSRDLSFKNIVIHDIKWNEDPLVIPSSGQNARGFAVVGRGAGIENLTINQCSVYNNVTGKSEALTLNGNVEGFVIEGCSVYDNTNIGICLAGNYGICNDPALDKTRNGIVRNNICYNNVSLLASSAGIYVDGGQDIIIERNTLYQNGTGIGVGCEKDGNAIYITVKNNLIFNNLGRGLAVGGYTNLTTGEVLYSTFRNNTLYQNNSALGFASEINLSKASFCIFEDNIVYANAQNILLAVDAKFPQQDNLFNYNCLFTSSGDPDDLNIYWHALSFDNLAGFQQDLSQEVNSFFADPQFLVDESQEISQSSVCVNGGNPQLSVEPGEVDFAGNPRVSGLSVDIGAFEMNYSLAINDSGISKMFMYPNPVIGDLVYFSSDASNATLKLYDQSGKVVATLANINGRNLDISSLQLASGIYLYHFVQNSSVSQGKLFIK